MSAVPKPNPGFWTESDTVITHWPEITAPKEKETRVKPKTESVPQAKVKQATESASIFDVIFKFEQSLSIAIMVFALLILSLVALQGSLAKLTARQERIYIQETQIDIARTLEGIETVRADQTANFEKQRLTLLPIEPEDSVTVEMPPPLR